MACVHRDSGRCFACLEITSLRADNERLRTALKGIRDKQLSRRHIGELPRLDRANLIAIIDAALAGKEGS